MADERNDGQLDQAVPDSYEELLDDYSHFAPPGADEVLQGTVLSLTAKDVIVDFGYKSEGIVPIEQFQGPGGEVTVRPGDVVDVMIDHGEQIGRLRPALPFEAPPGCGSGTTSKRPYQEQLTISGRVLGRVKGGLAVDVGVRGFMPGSQVDVRARCATWMRLFGQDIPVKIVKLNRTPRQRRGLAQAGRGGRSGRPQDRHPRVTPGRRGPHRHGQEPHRIRRIHRPRRHRRPAPRDRYLLRARHPPRPKCCTSATRSRSRC